MTKYPETYRGALDLGRASYHDIGDTDPRRLCPWDWPHEFHCVWLEGWREGEQAERAKQRRDIPS